MKVSIKKKNNILENLNNKKLFWDVEIKELDCEKNADFIIGRVLNFGDCADYEAVKEYYGLRKIKNAAKKVNYANKKSLNFWSLFLDLPFNSFKCTQKLSTKKSSAFWSR